MESWAPRRGPNGRRRKRICFANLHHARAGRAPQMCIPSLAGSVDGRLWQGNGGGGGERLPRNLISPRAFSTLSSRPPTFGVVSYGGWGSHKASRSWKSQRSTPREFTIRLLSFRGPRQTHDTSDRGRWFSMHGVSFVNVKHLHRLASEVAVGRVANELRAPCCKLRPQFASNALTQLSF